MNQLNSATVGFACQNSVKVAAFGDEDEEDQELLTVSERCAMMRRRSTRRSHRMVRVNVSGAVVETCLCVLERHPETILGHPHKRRQYWDAVRKEYFIDAHPPSFEAIYQFHQTDKIKKPFEVPLDTFLEQLEMFEVDPKVIDMYKFKEGILLDEVVILPEDSEVKRTLWKLFEVPTSSQGARVTAIISVTLIVLSLFLFCLETLPRFKNKKCIEKYVFNFQTGNGTTLRLSNFKSEFFLLETVCVLFFTVEYFVRLFACPDKKAFMKGPMNFVDLMSNAPYYILLTVTLVSNDCDVGRKNIVLNMMRTLRVCRIFKLSKHSRKLRIWIEALRASWNEFLVFLLFLILTGILYASLLFVAEQHQENRQIHNIPEGIWWAVATMTTVGYGDLVPTSLWGKITATLCVVSGVIAIALPTPIIVSNFHRFYCHRLDGGHESDNIGRRKH